VIVIGGGLAGLAAGVALAEAGCRVRLFEQRPFLGGRATSYVLPDGEHIDNCQHVTLGCCTNLSDFYSRVGASDKITFFDRLLFLDPQGRRGVMQAGILPAPFHMAGSFAAFAPLSLRDKLSIARAMLHIFRHRGHPPDITSEASISMLDWLRRRGQTPRAIDRFWRVVLVSALDEELDKTDARYGVDVFWKAFLSNRTGYRMGVPTVPLADLYDGCRSAIQQKGGEVIVRAPARCVRIENSACRGVGFDDGREESADAYILAIPHSKITDVLPADVVQNEPIFRNLKNITDAPITGVHFWFDRQVTTEPFLTLLDTHTQWIFNKSALNGSTNKTAQDGSNNQGKGPSSANSQYLQLVISASYDLLQEPRQKIIDLCLTEVRQAIPAARSANLLKATVVKETAATFSPVPGVDRWRPSQRSPVAKLFLAGDWTTTGWPATMEGAVRSGYLAAEAVLAEFGNPRSFLQSDLPPDGLVAWWVGNRKGPGQG
jgi:squalene-associated FAD-dependent desaturase